MRFSPRKEILHHVWSVYRLFTCSSYCTSNSIILQRQIRLMRSWHDKQVKIKKIKEKSWTTWKYVTDLKFFRWRSLLRYSSDNILSAEYGFSWLLISYISKRTVCHWMMLIQQTRGLKVLQKGRETNMHPGDVPAPANWQRGSVQRELSHLDRINLLPRLSIFMVLITALSKLFVI